MKVKAWIQYVPLVTGWCISVMVESYYDPEAFAAYETKYDHTNDDASLSTAQFLLARSGFNFTEHYVVTFDGYVVHLIHVINPLADQKKLKKPPVLMHPGGNIDNTCYLTSSSIQYHPEKYPRTAGDGPFTSFNRSLAPYLANVGYDVWLIGTRGMNIYNMGHTKYPNGTNSIPNGDFSGKNLTQGEINSVYERSQDFWQFGLDDIIAFDFAKTIDYVLNYTNSTEYFLFSYSLSTPTTMAFLGQNPDYAKRCRAYVQMAPAINAVHVTDYLAQIYFNDIVAASPTRGIGFFPSYVAQPLLRLAVTALSKSELLAYSLIYAFNYAFLGPTPPRLTDLDQNTVSHIFLPTSFKSTQHYAQNSNYQVLRKFDYGPLKNIKIYGSAVPPAYNISYLAIQNWCIIYGSGDAFADLATVEKLIAQTKTPTPVFKIFAPYFNHADYFGAVESDKYVNEPLAAYFDTLINQ